MAGFWSSANRQCGQPERGCDVYDYDYDYDCFQREPGQIKIALSLKSFLPISVHVSITAHMQTPVSLSHRQTNPEALRLGVKQVDAGPNQRALPCMWMYLSCFIAVTCLRHEVPSQRQKSLARLVIPSHLMIVGGGSSHTWAYRPARSGMSGPRLSSLTVISRILHGDFYLIHSVGVVT